jgi:hypothetical protein
VPTLLMDSLSAAFFGLPGADDWETAVRMANAKRFDRNHNPGQLRWAQLIKSVALPDDAQEVERLGAAVIHEIKQAQAEMTKVELALEKAIASSQLHADAMATLASATAEWARLEDTEVHALNALPANPSATPSTNRRASKGSASADASASASNFATLCMAAASAACEMASAAAAVAASASANSIFDNEAWV